MSGAARAAAAALRTAGRRCFHGGAQDVITAAGD